MQLRRAAVFGLAGLVAGQSGTPDLANALASQGSLSILSGLIANTTGLNQTLSGLTNVTLLAPSNDALNKVLNDSAMAAILSRPGILQTLLSYHTVDGTYYASNFASSMMGMFLPTHLNSSAGFANVTGGQRVEIMANGTNVTAYSGLRQPSNFVTTNVNFTGGTIHIIDTVLLVPPNVTYTLQQLNETAAVGAVNQAGLNMTLDMTTNLTMFAPSNAAFNAVGSVFANISMQALAQGLEYHVVRGLGYSNTLMNGSLTTLAGNTLNVTVFNGSVFVNNARVIIPDVLVANGVVHVIDQVLNPNGTDSNPNPSETTTGVAYTSASAGTAGVPFTSGVATPTSVAPAASTATSKTGAAMPIKTGAVAPAVLFGGAAALMMNM